MGGADSIRENVVSETPRNRLMLGETAILITDFVNAQPATTVGEIVEKFAIDRKSASQHLRRLWLGGFIGKRARGLFQPLASSPIPCEDSGDTEESEHTEDFVDAVGRDEIEDTEQVEDSGETQYEGPDVTDEFDDIEDTVDSAQPEDSDGTERSEDHDDTGDTEDSGDASASAGLSSGLHAAAARKDDPRVCTPGHCPDCGSELGKATGKCVQCIVDRARMRADQSGDSVVGNQEAACW